MSNIEKQFDNLIDSFYAEIENIEKHVRHFENMTKKMERQDKWLSADRMDGYRIQAQNDLKKHQKIVANLEKLRAMI